MSRASHKWKTISGKSRTAIALATAGAIGAVTVGVSSASTDVPHRDPAPVQAPQAGHGKLPHGLGVLPSRSTWRDSVLRHSVESRLVSAAPHVVGAGTSQEKVGATPPASVDLTKYAPTPGNQGQVGSCAAWAIDYTAYTILEREQKISAYPGAPMYTYAQISKGHDGGSAPQQHFKIAMSQGIDSRPHYWQGDFDYTTQPTASERANAAHWKLSGYTPLHTGAQIKADVKAALAKGEPVAISIRVYNSFFNLNSQKAASYTYYPASGEQYAGGHGVTIVGYNSKGVRVENSWGSGWGDHGFVNLSWKYLASNQVVEANAVGKLIHKP
ncbi:C1 family peptidase [Streptomyces sp. NPDC004296]|uniref:C1 family peptidase n=1 Tax=Streptomyces sp. NPDC004296 TaxID=3364697 RepID=UPI0036B54716